MYFCFQPVNYLIDHSFEFHLDLYDNHKKAVVYQERFSFILK